MRRDLLVNGTLGIDQPEGRGQHWQKVYPKYRRKETEIFLEPFLRGEREDREFDSQENDNENKRIMDHDFIVLPVCRLPVSGTKFPLKF